MTESPIVIRPIEVNDGSARVSTLVELTELIHRTYARHSSRGLRYWGTYQSVADNEARLESGQSFVAADSFGPVGTITIRPPQPDSGVPAYRDEATWSLGPFAVDPPIQGRGVGKILHEHGSKWARIEGARALALDTAESAQGLIALYRAWGCEIVGKPDWASPEKLPQRRHAQGHRAGLR